MIRSVRTRIDVRSEYDFAGPYIAAGLLLALPIEAGTLLLVGMMLDPGPVPAGLLPRSLAVEWVFFHFLDSA